MLKRTLGNTGLFVSEIAFGGVEIGMPYGIGVKSHSDMLSQSEAIKLLHAAIDGGINFFDTARTYGESERIMGKAFHDRRHQLVIATKCKRFLQADGSIPGYLLLRDIVTSSLQESLAELQTTYVDVFMLHHVNVNILQNNDVKRVFSELKQSGLIRATAASTYSLEETRVAIESSAWDVIQLPFNLMDQRQQEVFQLASESGIGLVIRSVLLKGLLSSKGRGLHPALKDVEQHIKNYSVLFDDSINDLPTFATKFALSFKEVSSVLVGIDRKEYLERSLQSADGHYLDFETLSRAKELRYPNPAFLNLPEWDRLGWLK